MIYDFLPDALRDGFQIYDRTQYGYLMRRRESRSGLWELAEVHVRRGGSR